MLRQCLQHKAHIAPRPRSDRPLGQTYLLVLYHQIWVKISDRAETGAVGARAMGAVEGKQAGRDLRIRRPTLDASEALAEVDLLGPFFGQALHFEQVASVFESGLERVGQALFDAFVNSQPVYDNLDCVVAVFVQGDIFLKVAHLPINLGAHEAQAPQFVQFFSVLALAATHDRRKHLKARPFRPGHDSVYDLWDCLSRNFAPAIVAVRTTHARKKQAQIVIYFGDGPHRGARIAGGAFLFDRDCG